MRITFVLPMYLNRPAGGFKIIYEYANRLQMRGHQVRLVHPRNCDHQAGLTESIKSRLWSKKIHWQNRPLLPWFSIDPGIKFDLIPDLREQFVAEGDAVVATGYQTARGVSRFGPARGRKLYFIQSYETWLGTPEEVDATWRMPFQKIVIAGWLLEVARGFGEEWRTTHIPNGVDFNEFRIDRPIAERHATKVCMLAHPAPWKGLKIGLIALEMARARVPGLQAVLFGTHARPAEIPDWIDYIERPSPEALRAIYNSSAIFLHSSQIEGWPLPPVEAMACGCALVAAANHGVREYAEDEVRALLAPVNDASTLAQQLVRTLTADALRIRLAEAGCRHVQQFTWTRAVDSLEAVLTKTEIESGRTAGLHSHCQL
jgi:glycosyltransferase involved in cell wall biosynthesis